MYVSICVIPRGGKESQMCLKHNKLMRIVHVFSVLIVFCRFCVVSPIMSNKLQNLWVYSTLSLQFYLKRDPRWLILPARVANKNTGFALYYPQRLQVIGLVIWLRLIIFVPRSEQLSESEAQRNLWASRNRHCPRTNKGAYFCVKWRSLCLLSFW